MRDILVMLALSAIGVFFVALANPADFGLYFLVGTP